MTEPSETSAFRDHPPDETAAEEHDVLAADEDQSDRAADEDDQGSFVGLIPTIGPGGIAGPVAANTERAEAPNSGP
jgi:hypothetical protein